MTKVIKKKIQKKTMSKNKTNSNIRKGLVGVITDTTAVSKVMPETNSLTYRGHPVQDLAAKCSFEEVAYLILNGELPNQKQLTAFRKKRTFAEETFDYTYASHLQVP